MLFSMIIFVLFQSIIGANAGNILAVVPSPSFSHQIVFQPIWKELSLRGHQVTTITTDPIKDPLLTNLTEIDLHYIYEKWNAVKSQLMEEMKQSAFNIPNVLHFMTNLIDDELQNPAVQDLIRNKEQHFDLVMVEFMSPIVLAFGEIFKCPVISVMSLGAINQLHNQMGNPTHPILYPPLGVPFIEKLSFIERLMSVMFAIFIDTFYLCTKSEIQSVVNKHFGASSSDIDDLLEKIDMVFINTDPILHPVRPLVPAVVQIGAGIHLKPPKPLPKDIQRYLDNASEGAIYFSLGSNAQSMDLTKNVLKIIKQSLSKLPYKILWKFEDQLAGKPDNVMITKWAPQQDILRHPNIKLFISQCGMQSTDEAFHSGIPTLGMPMFGDQFANARLLESKGIGLSVYHNTLTEEEFTNKILELIQNPKYRMQVKKLSNLAKDQPMTGLEKAVWWTEYVIRNKGAKHLRGPAIDIPVYQYYLLDIIGFFSLLIVVIAFIILKVIGFLCKLKNLFGRTSKVKVT